MKVLIVGSKGFIGSHLQQSLADEHEVWGCDVYTNYNEKNFFLVQNAFTDFSEIFLHQKFDICINCSGASSVPDSIKNPARDFDLNVHNVLLILEAIRLNGSTCKFINLSSAAVYGNPQQLPISEEHALNPMSPYGFHKMYSEKLCLEYFLYFQVPTCSIRIFSAYGPRLRKQIFWDLFLKSKSTNSIDLFGTGRETRDFIFIEDIVDAIKCLLKNGAFEATVYNLANGKAHTINEVANTFMEIIGWSGEIKFNRVHRDGDPDFWEADISKIKKLGFAPKVTLEEGVKKYAKWISSLD
jgi:dTDP-glucose 4,6-dehydratase/UDP-glucose 4-epimerase